MSFEEQSHLLDGRVIKYMHAKMGNNMHLGPEKQAWDTIPNWKERNGWSSITAGTSFKGMECSSVDACMASN